tara:strand:+ start:101 stop:658 length:558 start_codon:yes stop_codon:yes gene_type:complete
MIDKKISMEIDLVFKNAYEFVPIKFNSINKQDTIFKNIFWEKTFLKWIKILFKEFNKSLPASILNKRSFSFSFEIVDNATIAELNKKWLNKAGPTDVLSFPIIPKDELKNDFNCIELGDIFVSLEMAINQSLEYNNSVEEEIIWLSSHGLLHLLGWDHQDQNQLENMLKVQEYLISKLNNDYYKK